MSVAKVTSNAERRVMEYIFHSNNYSTDERPVLNASESVEVVTSLFMVAILDLVSNKKAQNQFPKSATFKPLSLKQEPGRYSPKARDNLCGPTEGKRVSVYREEPTC